MPIDFEYSTQALALAERTAALIAEHILPVEDDFGGDINAAGGDEARVVLQSLARDAEVFAPHAPREFGGLGLNMCDRAPLFEAAGYSLFGPLALNIAAPDEGNMHLLAHVAKPEQKERYLRPLVGGEIRSAFAMTEPAPGAGSDPSMLATIARRSGAGWSLTGRKCFITGADGAGFFIVMARTAGTPGERGGATMFLVDSHKPGVHVGRHIATMDHSMVGGHCEVSFSEVRLTEADVLGEVNEGFRYAQVRLGPARMTHVMRWLGAARRAHDVAAAHVVGRAGFGGKLANLGMIQNLLADNEIDLAATRALLLRACWDLDRGRAASAETSIAKTFGAEAINRIVDRSMQMCGGLGVSDDLPIARIAREVRPFRIYDGPSEVHRWSLAQKVVRRVRTPDLTSS